MISSLRISLHRLGFRRQHRRHDRRAGKSSPKLPADVKVIPGQGNVSNLDDVRALREDAERPARSWRRALKKHKTLDQLKQEKVLEPWKK